MWVRLRVLAFGVAVRLRGFFFWLKRSTSRSSGSKSRQNSLDPGV